MTDRTASAPILRRVRELQGYTIGATDGDVGSIEDVYFDDQSWTIRYFVVDTGAWLPGRKVLISPLSLRGVDTVGVRLESSLSRQQVKESPSVDTAMPVSRQHEIAAAQYYGSPFYWTGPYRWGPWPYPGGDPVTGTPYPDPVYPDPVAQEITARQADSADSHLRSANAVRGYGIEATDGSLGHVVDFLADEQSWAIRYVVVDPQSWWPGPHVILSTDWIEDVSWNDSKVIVNVSRDTVRNAPPYDPTGPLPREYEARLHGHYRRPEYWNRPPEEWRRAS
jgi:hypothetical protein